MIKQIYEQQLDVILFSVNQYLWDNLTSWQSRINRIRTQSEAYAEAVKETEYSKLIEELPVLQMLAFSDTALGRWRFFFRSDYNGNADLLRRTITDRLEKKSAFAEQTGKIQQSQLQQN